MAILSRIAAWLLRKSRGAETADEVRSEEHRPQTEPVSPARRQFLARLAVASGALATVVVGVPLVGVLFSPLIRRPPDVWRAVGPVDEFPPGETVVVTYLDAEVLPWAGFAAQSAAFLRRTADDAFVAFSIYCTHTGCPLRWEAGAGMFLCPCHGGVFHADGSVAAGPPPVPLPTIPVRVRDGQVELLAAPVPLPR